MAVTTREEAFEWVEKHDTLINLYMDKSDITKWCIPSEWGLKTSGKDKSCGIDVEVCILGIPACSIDIEPGESDVSIIYKKIASYYATPDVIDLVRSEIAPSEFAEHVEELQRLQQDKQLARSRAQPGCTPS